MLKKQRLYLFALACLVFRFFISAQSVGQESPQYGVVPSIQAMQAKDFRQTIDRLVDTDAKASEPGAAFQFDYWFAIQGIIPYAFAPDDPLFIQYGKPSIIVISTMSSSATGLMSESQPTYYYFDSNGRLDGLASYSDGEYYLDRFVYDSESRLIGRIQGNQTGKPVSQNISIQYSQWKGGSRCVISGSGTKEIRETRDGNAVSYALYDPKKVHENKLVVLFNDNQITSLDYTIYYGAGKSESVRKRVLTDGRWTEFTSGFGRANGDTEIMLSKTYSYDSSAILKNIEIRDFRSIQNSGRAEVQAIDAYGNWTRLVYREYSGDVITVNRSISYGKAN